MKPKKATICPKYVIPGCECNVMARLEESISEGKSGAKEVREILQQEYCAWDCFSDCAFYKSMERRKANDL